MERTWEILLTRAELLELRNAIKFAMKNDVIDTKIGPAILLQIEDQLTAA